MGQYFYVDKTTGTFSDELLCAGFVRLLENLFFRQGVSSPEIVQVDCGPHYKIEVEPALDFSRLTADLAPFVLAPVLKTSKNKEQLPDLPDNPLYVVDYDQEKEKRAAFFAGYSGLGGTIKRAYAIGDDANVPFESLPTPPHEQWNVFSLLNAPPMPINGYNQLMLQWLTLGDAQQMGTACLLLCQLFSQSPNDVDTAVAQWKTIAKPYKWTETVTASQFFNPSQGKGINKALPNSIGLGNLSTFWLFEWLKAVGFYHNAMTARVKNSDDRKTYVPAIGRANLRAWNAIQHEFKKKMRFGETAVRADIFTVIRYVQAFIEKVEEAQSKEESDLVKEILELIGEQTRPADFMRGFHVTFYKSLGTAASTMNISFLNLPGWVKIEQPDDTAVFHEILEEQERIIQQFAENKGEEIELLQRFRDFIVADNLDPFFEFTTAYSSWLISHGEKPGFPPRKFTVHNLRRLIVSNNPQFSKIVDSTGFKNIAYAIRQSTVTAQYWRSKNDRRYDVRYGLGRDLVRHSQYPDEFIAALSDFLHKYNAENAQVKETRSGPYRRDVHINDIQEILQLIDEYGPDIIAKLLVAYGYASDIKAKVEEEEATSSELADDELNDE